MHICKLNLKFLGLAYSPSGGGSAYCFKTSELYCCKKCGKLIHRNSQVYSHDFSSMYNTRIKQIRECGYRSIGELLKSVENEVSA